MSEVQILKCLVCGNPVKQTPGKRQRITCNTNCRQALYQMKHKPKMRLIPLAEYERLLKAGEVSKPLPVIKGVEGLEGLLDIYNE